MQTATVTHDKTARLIMRGIEVAASRPNGLHHGWADVAAWVSDHDPELANVIRDFNKTVTNAIVEHERK